MRHRDEEEDQLSMPTQAELKAAVDIAKEGGDILLSYAGSDRMDARSKGPRDVVTAADLASENHVLRRLTELFPKDGVVAEEGSTVDVRSGRSWYVDPLDGTMNYSRGIPVWTVSLSLFERGRPVLGVVYDPVRREAFSALRGEGAWCNGRAIRCSAVTDLASAFVHLTIDFNDQSMLEGVQDVTLIAPQVLRTRNIGSAALALAYVAAGRFDAMVHRFAHAWDYGAGVILVQEAGGRVSDLAGQPYTAQTFALAAGASEALQQALVGLVGTSQGRE